MEMVKQERELQTPYLHSQASWKKFWETRKGKLSPKTKKVFNKNIGHILDILEYHYGEFYSGNMKSLEIGYGRGTVSCYLRHWCGFRTFGIDIADNRFLCTENPKSGKTFVLGDARLLPYKPEAFDVVVTYGLAEHFFFDEQLTIIGNCINLLKRGGIAIHYIVPRKLTNYFEDKNVYRDKCKHLQCWYPGDWVYPIIGENWKTNKWLGKGFFITQRR